MRLRFRIGPFTFGKSGTRLSVWKKGSGISIPLTKRKGGTFGKVKVGPVNAHFGHPAKKSTSTKKQIAPSKNENIAIQALASNEQLLHQLQTNGVPWRGIQESLKEALPNSVDNRNNVAYKLVPQAMNSLFGPQHKAWSTEKRPAKNGKGETTWIILR